MATQGMMTVTQGGKVILKVIAGSNGNNVSKLEKEFKKSPTTDLEQVYNMAIITNFGDPKVDLVAMDAEKEIFNGDEDLGHFYRHTFHKPTQNPRWTVKVTENTVVVRMEDIQNPETI